MKIKNIIIKPSKVIIGGLMLVASVLVGKVATDVCEEGIKHEPNDDKADDTTKEEDSVEVSEETTEETAKADVLDENGNKVD